MKNYYIECSIKYTDNSEDEIFLGVEYYSLTVESISKKEAKDEAKKICKELFDVEAEECYSNIKVVIDNCYETSSDARSS